MHHFSALNVVKNMKLFEHLLYMANTKTPEYFIFVLKMNIRMIQLSNTTSGLPQHKLTSL